MAVDILYFAWVRERVGIDGERVDPPATVTSIADLVDWLATRSPAHAAALADRPRLRFAIDQKIAAPGVAVAGAREIAIFPPVTGG